MSSNSDVQKLCEEIQKNYSACDVSDALLTLHVPSAGFLADIVPIPKKSSKSSRIVAPVSTLVFVPISHAAGSPFAEGIPKANNIPSGKHFTDCAAPGSILLMQQPANQLVAVLGDIVATRLKLRGVLGAVTNGRVRDVVSCDEICSDGKFTVWSQALSTVGTSMESKAWAVDVPIKFGEVEITPGDVLVADEGERGCTVIPKVKLERVVELLKVQKKADDGLLNDVRNGMGMSEAVKGWPDHYSLQPH